MMKELFRKKHEFFIHEKGRELCLKAISHAFLELTAFHKKINTLDKLFHQDYMGYSFIYICYYNLHEKIVSREDIFP